MLFLFFLAGTLLREDCMEYYRECKNCNHRYTEEEYKNLSKATLAGVSLGWTRCSQPNCGSLVFRTVNVEEKRSA